jgi:chorismate mutase
MNRAIDTDPTLAAMPQPSQAADASAGGQNPLTALREEIDALDDALHDLLTRRAGVVARLAGSRAKANGPTLRPGREAQVLRRLLARTEGTPLPAAAVVRLWRDIFAASTGLQGPFSVVAFANEGEEMRVAREHFGALTPLRRVTTPARALAMVASGEASAAVLPLPREGEPPEAAWWAGLDSPRLQVAARLPYWSPAGAEQESESLVVAPGAPDPSGTDRSLLRLDCGTGTDAAARSRTGLQAALAAAGLVVPEGGMIVLCRDGASAGLALAEVEGVVAADDPRLKALRVGHALPLGFYAVPLRGGTTAI